MNETVSNFYLKNPEQNYIDCYERDHGPRLDDLVAHFKLKDLTNIHVVDIGGGLGFMGKRLDPSVDYWVIDGAEVPENKRLCKGTYLKQDLDYNYFGTRPLHSMMVDECGEPFSGPSVESPLFDIAFFLETFEHLSNGYHALIEIKKLVKQDGSIFISIPTETVWHNAPYPGLLWPRQNFEQFLEQMALPVREFYACTKSWPTYNYHCRNANWHEARMLFPKSEAKFQGKTPLEYTNL
jgi:SAM-dependent methyltransferase